jgi:hypothetical protein
MAIRVVVGIFEDPVDRRDGPQLRVPPEVVVVVGHGALPFIESWMEKLSGS